MAMAMAMAMAMEEEIPPTLDELKHDSFHFCNISLKIALALPITKYEKDIQSTTQSDFQHVTWVFTFRELKY